MEAVLNQESSPSQPSTDAKQATPNLKNDYYSHASADQKFGRSLVGLLWFKVSSKSVVWMPSGSAEGNG